MHSNGEDEWVLPVTWIKTVSKGDAVWEKGMFANENSACKMRNTFTLGCLHDAFGIPED